MIVDTHVHVWWPEDGHKVLIRERVAKLDADFGFHRLLPQLQPAGVGRVILVSAAQSFAETTRLLMVAAQFPQQVAGVIGYLDIDATGFEARLDEATSNAALAGLRLPLVIIDDPNWIRRPRVGTALATLASRGLVAQILAGPAHLAACAEVLAEHPALKVVIDHAGNPGAQPNLDEIWRQGLLAVATRTNALCKIGDFSLPAGPLADAGRCDAILQFVVACFGERRLLFGSNWPVSGLQQAYSHVLDGLYSTARRVGLDPAHLAMNMTRNAQRIFAGRPIAKADKS